MRCATDGGVCGDLFRCELERFFLLLEGVCLCFKAVLKFHEPFLVVGLAELVDFLHVLACQLVEDFFRAVVVLGAFHVEELSFAELASGHDVELASRRFALRVHIIAHSCCSQCALLVEELRYELGRYGVTHISSAQLCGIWRSLAVRVACLNHELADDAVEEGAVVHAFLGELDEVIAVFRSFVVKFHDDVALGGFDFHLGSFFHFC